MFEIICEFCGNSDWKLFGDKNGNIKRIDCKTCMNLIPEQTLKEMFKIESIV